MLGTQTDQNPKSLVWLGRLDTSVIYQLPCPVCPELSTKKLANQKAAFDTQLSCPVSPDLLKCYTQAVYLGRLDHSM